MNLALRASHSWTGARGHDEHLVEERQLMKRSRPEAGPCQNVSVLLVEDHEDSRELLVFALEQAGATVMAVASADEALLWMKTIRPQVLVSDLSMPGRDGFSLLHEVRSSPDLKDLPAIAVTGHTQPETLARAARTGFQRCLGKPVNITELCEAITTLAHGAPS
jgi:CheY-like chemotaxis protein